MINLCIGYPRDKEALEKLRKQAKEKTKVANGGAGSGNFGHAGRPGKVGGSAPTGSSSADLSWPTTPEGREQWLASIRKGELIEKTNRMRSLKSFDEAHIAALREVGFSEETIEVMKQRVLAKQMVAAETQDRKKAIRARIKDSPEQKEAIENVIGKTRMLGKDATWLRNNCDVEMAQALSREIDRAKEGGIDNIWITLNESVSFNGRMGYVAIRDEYDLTLRKGILRDAEETRRRRKEDGPNGSRYKTSEDIGGTFAHEFGHGLEMAFIKSLVGNRQIAESSTQLTVIRPDCSGAIVHQAMRNLEKKGISKMEIAENKDRKYMSGYGLTNNSEAIAESHSNPDFSVFTKEIDNIVTGKSKVDKDLLDPIMKRVEAMEEVYKKYDKYERYERW